MNSESSTNHKQLTIKINVSDIERLGEGLESWQRLGLIDDQQVQQICETYLSCPIRETVTTFTPEIETPSTLSPPQPILSPFIFTPFTRFQELASSLWTSFRDELSVRWLLFLGLFLVLVSSGVLAATQWQTFPNIGQYLILFAYTLGFLGVSIWANNQQNLQLTAKSLENISLLLIPTNFWAMDAFNLWNKSFNLIIIVIAALTLSYVYYRYRRRIQSHWVIINFLGLCYLHWGWNFSSLPLRFLYLATLATTVILTGLRVPKIFPNTRRYQRDTAKGFVMYGLGVLLFRAIFIVNLPLSKLGIAIALMGWLLQCHNPRLKSSVTDTSLTSLLEGIGGILLLLGYVSVVTLSFPWQALIITILTLHFFVERLQRQASRKNLLALYCIGFQCCFLLWRLIPLNNRGELLDFALNFSHSSTFPYAIFSLFLFPYIWGWMVISQKLGHRLANFSETLNFLLGIILIAVGFINPFVRSLVLLLSSLTLVYYLRLYPTKLKLVYLSHLLGLGGIISLIYWSFPQLSFSAWGTVFLGLMVMEWGFSILRTFPNASPIIQTCYQSCWYFGFVLGIISYSLILFSLDPLFLGDNRNLQGLLWLMTPVSLTFVSSQVRSRHQSRKAAFLSGYVLMIAQSLTLWHPDTRLISLGIAAILMIGNSYYLRHPIAATLQLGFSIAVINSGYLKQFSSSLDEILLLNSGIICLVWLIYLYFRSASHFWGKIYAKASNRWGIILTSIITMSLTVIQFSFFDTKVNYVITILVLMVILIYRYWQKPDNITIYTLAWLGELGILQVVGIREGSLLMAASVNIIVGLISLIGIRYLFTIYPRFTSLFSLKIISLFFGVIGILGRLDTFNQYTGLLTIGCAVIGLGVASYLYYRKVIVYLSFLGISLGIYEIAFYQSLQTQGNFYQRFFYLILVSSLLAISYRLTIWLRNKQGKQHLSHLSLKEVEIIGHLHWGVASLLKLLFCLSLLLGGTVNIHPLALIASLSLAGYGILQGRNISIQSSMWIYLGCSDIVLTTLLTRFIWTNLAIIDPYWGLITIILSFLIYILPWHQWGWQQKSWQMVGLGLPILIILLTFQVISRISLMAAAAYYFYMSIRRRNIRWSYLTLIFLNWLLGQTLYDNEIKTLLIYISLMGLSLIYIAQVDPSLQQRTYHKSRHYLRLTGSGIISLTALLFHQTTGLIPASLGLIGIFTGLGLQIRAFLFVGTTTFMLTVAYQLLILSFKYAFLKWVLGLMLGIVLIAIAANFEQRRGQLVSLWELWQQRWDNWQ